MTDLVEGVVTALFVIGVIYVMHCVLGVETPYPKTRKTHRGMKMMGVNNPDEGLRFCGLCGGDVPDGFKHKHGYGVCVKDRSRDYE